MRPRRAAEGTHVVSPEIPGDTIVAAATPAGRGGVAIVRLSGPQAATYAQTLAGSLPPPRAATRRTFRDDRGPIDDGLLLYFPAPYSYTGEDVIEFQGHGSPVAVDLIVQRLIALGARHARPGEFTERAYLNGRMALADAEAVADFIDAASEAALRSAQRSLSGVFSKHVNALREAIEQLRIEVEASIDFSDEDIQLIEEAGITERLEIVLSELNDLTATAQEGRLLNEGCTVTIAGRPNAGKSSLMNALSGHETAIVTSIPGTTRDVLRERINLYGLPVWLLDTAGLRESADPVEAEGIQRARRAAADADLVLYLVDSSDEDARRHAAQEIESLNRTNVTAVYTKADLEANAPVGALSVSRHDAASIERLRQWMSARLRVGNTHEGTLSARRRHLDALETTRTYLEASSRCADDGATDLMAENLRLAHESLGTITGVVTSDDLLGRIFSTFCIGK